MRRLAALALAVTTSCSFAPHYERPAAPVSNQFGSDSGSLAAADQGWRTMFADPRLQALISLALANNRDLRIAAFNVELTRAQYRVEEAGLYPQAGAGAGAELSNLEPPRRYRVGLTASWELDLFGRVRSLKEAALQEFLASESTHRAAHLALVGEVVTQYLRERAYAEERELAVRTQESMREMYEITKRMLEAGQRSELDMRSAEAQMEGARAEVARYTRLQAQATNALVLLVGAPLPQSLPAPQALDSQQMVAELAAGIPSQVLLRRPDVIAAEHTLRAANANIGAARAAFFPRISLTGFGGLVSTALSSLFSGGALAWTFAPQLSVPIFEGGRNEATLHVAHLRKRIEVARYEKAIQVAFREVADALAARALYDEQLAALAARTQAEQVRVQLSEQRYRSGIESYLTVLDAQRDLYSAQTQLIEVRLARLTNLADLYRALGGGWRE